MAKTYVGNGRKRSDTWFKISLDLEKLQAGAVTGKNGKKYVNIDVNVKDQKDQYGNDVSATLDEWKPEGNGSRTAPPPAAAAAPSAASAPESHTIQDHDDDLPF